MSDDAKTLSQRQFGAHAASYVTSLNHAKGQNLVRLIELVNPQPGWRALDLATGGGHTALALAKQGAWTVAGDLTLPMLRVAREFIDQNGQAVVYTRLDAEQLPYMANTFDVVTCRIAAHHFPNVAQFVRECVRVTKPGGVVAVIDQLSDPNPKVARYSNAFERLRDPSHVWAYNLAEWTSFFTSAGLTVEHTEMFETQHNLTTWATQMGCDKDTILRLQAMLKHAPKKVAAWMKPNVPAVGDAQFVIQQFLLIGRKG
jgi:ubiquinone/menaquinone biosynthesis C-methylase UbiE